MTDNPTPPLDPAHLGIIRIAMLVAVLAFGAVTWFLHRSPDFVPWEMPDVFRILLPAGMAIAGLGILGMRAKVGRTTDPSAIGAHMLIGYAMGEGAALFGGVYYFLTDDARWYIIGLFILLGAFIILPLRRT